MKLIRTIILSIMVFSSVIVTGQETDWYIKNAIEVSHLSRPSLEWQVMRQHISSTSNIQHIYFRQLLDGVPIRGTESSLHISSDGKVCLKAFDLLLTFQN